MTASTNEQGWPLTTRTSVRCLLITGHGSSQAGMTSVIGSLPSLGSPGHAPPGARPALKMNWLRLPPDQGDDVDSPAGHAARDTLVDYLNASPDMPTVIAADQVASPWVVEVISRHRPHHLRSLVLSGCESLPAPGVSINSDRIVLFVGEKDLARTTTSPHPALVVDSRTILEITGGVSLAGPVQEPAIVRWIGERVLFHLADA